jgi:hypothetical protein
MGNENKGDWLAVLCYRRTCGNETGKMRGKPE